MSFGQNYTNKFLFDFENGWTVEMVREWAVANGYNINTVNPNLEQHHPNHTTQVLMVYTPSQTQIKHN